MKKKIILSAIAIIALGVLFWLFNTSTIQITVTSGQTGSFSYKLYNQADKKTTEIKSSSKTISKMVSKGNYEVTVQNGDDSYFTVISTSGFLKKTVVTSKLSAENARRFVGDNPEACANYVDTALVSYPCNGLFSDMKVHTPATTSTPTTTLTNPNADSVGSIEGVVKTSEGTLALVYLPGDEDSEAEHDVYVLKNGFNTVRTAKLVGLDKNTSYAMKAYRDGFILYNQDSGEVEYFASTGAPAVKINIAAATNNKLGTKSINTTKDAIVSLNTSATDAKPADAASEIIVYTDGKSQRYSIKKGFSSATTCGTKKLCAINSDGLNVYDISGSEAKFSYLVSGVSDSIVTQSGFYAVRNNDVLNLNINSGTGYISYDLGGYALNNASVDGDNYILNLTNSKNKKVALYVNTGDTNSDSIDQKIDKLAQLSEVDNLTIYDKFIFVTPALGDLVYDDALGSFTYDNTKKAAANAKINQKINELGINTSIYKIINVLN